MSSLFYDYFDWLVEYSGLDNVRGRSYKSLAQCLHDREFVSLVPHDENRVADGVALREEFIQDEGLEFDDEADDLLNFEHCSVLEMIVAIAKRMDFEVYDPDRPIVRVPEFVFTLISNLGLDIFDDDYLDEAECEEVNDILTTLVDRTYCSNGEGGLFPLLDPDEDQTTVEIWQQMMRYMREEGYV